jgi:tRNA-specific 2-thiouridylase
MAQAFKERVIDYFVRTYQSGGTPNPCVVCNRHLKFNLLMDHLISNGDADCFATGHYADRVMIDGRWFLKEPRDLKKSQIYFLSMISPERLADILFPLSNSLVTEVREKVKDLPLANVKESQDVCFLQNRVLIDFLKECLPGLFREGDILDPDGNVIGKHPGALHYTIGQRRGTRFPSDRKRYVISKDVDKNTVTLGDNDQLMGTVLRVGQPVFWRRISAGDVFSVKVRYLGQRVSAVIEQVTDHEIRAVFKKPVRAITPGQIGVFYDDDIIVASGIIL